MQYLRKNNVRASSLLLSTVVLLSTVLMSCSPAVHVETGSSVDLGRYKTYQWVETRASQADTKDVTAFGEQTIHDAASRLLQQKGLREVSSNPDLLITHDVLVERSRERRSDPVYTQPFTRYYYNPYFRRWGTVYYPSAFYGYDTYTVPVRQGTVTLTLMDAATDKAVWQAWTTQQLDSRRFSNRELEKSIQNVLKKLKLPSNGTNATASSSR